MFKFYFNQLSIYLILLASLFSGSAISAQTNPINEKNGAIIKQVFNEVRANDNWKLAFLTGEHAQIVFMNISPMTNPKNEIGMEVHAFDQVILVVQGNGKAILAGKTSDINQGDLIFIPKGTYHNIINLTPNNAPMKIMSFYSSQDIPNKAVYPKKINEQNH